MFHDPPVRTRAASRWCIEPSPRGRTDLSLRGRVEGGSPIDDRTQALGTRDPGAVAPSRRCSRPCVRGPAIVARVPGRQRIFVVSTTAGEPELLRIRDDLGRDPVVLSAPTAEAKRVVGVLEVVPQVELLLAPVSFPHADRGHRLDALVRRVAVQDRFRDVVVVTDSATSTLLLRALAPDQLPTGGAVTAVGLVRGDRPVAVRRAVVSGAVLGVAAGVAEPLAPILALPGAVALVGLALLLVPPSRHLGRELLLAAAIAVAVVLAIVAG